MKILLSLFIITFGYNIFVCHCNEDEVIILPGLRFQPSFKHYSGYLNGSTTRKLHYWFVESQKSPEQDPLVLWLNGGPGCSSLEGLLSEHGPFRVTHDSYLIDNPHSWNKIANVIYLESPACVGFSYSTDGYCNASDDTTSLLNYNSLLHFLIKFPQFKNRDFYIAGESYAGFYIPTLSVRIISSKGLQLNFRGIAVGNGISSGPINNNGNFHFAYYHGLFSDSLWSEILSQCCKGQDTSHCDITGNESANCQEKVSQAVNGVGNLNMYNIYSDCVTSKNIVKNEIWSLLGVNSNYEKVQILSGWSDDHRIKKLREKYKILVSVAKNFELGSNVPCIDDSASRKYLNNPKVRYALHIPDNARQWSLCSNAPNFEYKFQYENMTSQYLQLFALPDFKIWIYNGDVDMACSYLGAEWYFETFNQKVIIPRQPWYYKEENNSTQVGGYVKVWEKIVLVTIRGAGHLVPKDKPIPAYLMLESFISEKFSNLIREI